MATVLEVAKGIIEWIREQGGEVTYAELQAQLPGTGAAEVLAAVRKMAEFSVSQVDGETVHLIKVS